MWIFRLVLVISFFWCAMILGQLNMYETEWKLSKTLVSTPLQFDCLYYSVNDDSIEDDRDYSNLIEQTIAYCQRPREKENEISMDTFQNTRDQHFTFEELYKNEISSEQLLSWSASIDVVERYQTYLNHVTNKSIFDSSDIFYNCTSPWFGTYCQYTFNLSVGISMGKIIQIIFRGKWKYSETYRTTNLTCYEHLKCDRGHSRICLDWREICDGKVDCLDEGAVDEIFCFPLERSECSNKNEFRCHNGQCIPAYFSQDDPKNPDCLDRSDEMDEYAEIDRCYKDPTFRCEEKVCRAGPKQFSCGDGQCVYLSSSCQNGRAELFTKPILTIQNPLENQFCQDVAKCFAEFRYTSETRSCVIEDKKYYDIQLVELFRKDCPSVFVFPSMPMFFHQIRLVYDADISNFNVEKILKPDYICYNQHRCDFHSSFPIFNRTCIDAHELMLDAKVNEQFTWLSLLDSIQTHFRSCLITNLSYSIENETLFSNQSILYSCANSKKVISTHRLVDGIADCSGNDDEQFNTSCALNHKNRLHCLNENKCPSQVSSADICLHGHFSNDVDNSLSFQKICNGIIEMTPVFIDGRNETDESDCGEQWPCDNIYTRCDQYWLCSNQLDEGNCFNPMCSVEQRDCVSPTTLKMICLSINQTHDGITNCLGATDEEFFCENEYPYTLERFRCANEGKCVTANSLCNNHVDCWPERDDERFCSSRSPGNIYDDVFPNNHTQEEKFLHHVLNKRKKPPPQYFKLQSSVIQSSTPHLQRKGITNSDMVYYPDLVEWASICNRGLYVRYWLGDTNSTYKCLCPPNYYGNTCQYQNQRVSLILTFLPVNLRQSYILVVMLITNDNETEEIHSHQQIFHSPIRDCKVKYNIYLLYGSQPKNTSNNYTVRIHAFTQTLNSVKYHASWLLPITFSFLPVNSIVAQLVIPATSSVTVDACSFLCETPNQCVKYVNIEKSMCLCNRNLSGAQCSLAMDCSDCSSDSFCLGTNGRRPICVCPLNKRGPRCQLTVQCTPDFCQNQGTCVASKIFASGISFRCICTEPFFGQKCEQEKNQIKITFNGIKVLSYIKAHIITINNTKQPMHTRLLKKVALEQDSVRFYTSVVLDLVFVEYNSIYHLILTQLFTNKSSTISRALLPSHQCQPIQLLFNLTMKNWHELRRIKYYHWLCSQHRSVQCFFDETLMCLCTNERHANCFNFEAQSASSACSSSYCFNDAPCIQDYPICPLEKVCLCTGCFYGDRCEFYIEDLSISLEAILNYEIQQYVSFNQQSLTVKIAAVVLMIMFTFGFINGCLSILTFKSYQLRTVGCGIYLLTSSITSLLIMILFALNFWLLIIVQSNKLINRSFLLIRCVTIEPLLRIVFTMDNWINACIAIDRALTLYQGVHFSKKKSKKIAKWVLLLVILLSIAFGMHEPFHRRLFDDEETQRIWCVVDYSSTIQTLNKIFLLFHFITPVVINFLSAFFIIVWGVYKQKLLWKDKTYRELIRKHVRQHQHILIAPIVLVILAVPRIIISLTSSCVKTSNSSLLLLVGYFISFIPSMIVFIVFVVPSKTFKTDLKKTINHIRRLIQRN